MKKRVNLTISDREENIFLEAKGRFFKNIKLSTMIKSLALDYAEFLLKNKDDKEKYKQLNLLTGGE